MKTIKCVIFASLFLISAAGIVAPTEGQPKNKPAVPVISNVEGDVSVKSAVSGAWQPVKEVNYPLKNASTIRTKAGTAHIACPDGSKIRLSNNTTAMLSIAGDGRVQIDTAQGSVSVVLGKSGATAELGPDQAIQEKYTETTGEVDVSCVKGNAAVRMPNGTMVALHEGDVITASPKKNIIKSQAGTVEVTKGTETRPLNVGFEIVIDNVTPFAVRRFPYVYGGYRYMTDYVTTTEQYTVTEETIPVEEKEIEEPAAKVEEQESPVEEKEAPEPDASGTVDNSIDSGDTGGDTGGDAGGDSGGDSGGGDGGGGE